MKYLKELEPARQAAEGVPSASPVYTSRVDRATGATNLSEMFYASVEKFPDQPCLGYRPGPGKPYEWYSYKQVGDSAAQLSGFFSNVCGLNSQDRVAVYGANSPEWMTAMQACNRMALYVVPLYDTLGDAALEFIIKHSESTVVCVSSAKFSSLVQVLPVLEGQVKNIVVWGAVDEAAQKTAADAGVTVTQWKAAIAEGKNSPVEPAGAKPDDICTIMYTSGTTGDPKGVLITHAIIAAFAASVGNWWDAMGMHMDEKDVFLSYLPLAHIFDRVVEEYVLSIGGKIGYWMGDIKGLTGPEGDIVACKPSLFIGVPRVFDRIYAGFNAKMAAVPGIIGRIKRWLFGRGYRIKLEALKRGVDLDAAAPWYDKKVFSKVKEALGGNTRLIISGGAPLSTHVEDFLRVTMCTPVIQGYGLTETCGGSFVSAPGNYGHCGTVGIPLPVTEFRLESVPDMEKDALAATPQGEVLIKGPCVFKGYYKQEEKTKEVLGDDGWFHTGDIGELQPDGSLKIIDRMKNIFKLSQGEYVAAEKIEGILKKCDSVEQIWIYGNSFESCLVAVVVPSAAATKALEAAGTDVTSEEAAKTICDKLNAIGREGGLKGFELPKKVILSTEEFTQDNDLITPTFKLKRPQLQKKYQEKIDAAYASMK